MALARIHQELGPDAVVLNVRPLPGAGLTRLWQKNRRIEIVVGIPDEPRASEPARAAHGAPGSFSIHNPDLNPASSDRWRCVAWLEAKGLLPEFAVRLQSLLSSVHAQSPSDLDAEWDLVSSALCSFWRNPPPLENAAATQPHVFVGPAGSGKTTVLCKWLTLAVLTEERVAQVWRLDGSTGNTAEFLSIHCEMLGTPIERFWSPPRCLANLLFIDLPGIDADDSKAIAALRRQLAALPSPRVHLVLNAAYETSTLLSQWRAFSALEPEDVIFTHLDEQRERVKLWNFVFAADRGIRFLSAGQKIPGEFRSALPGLLFPSEIQR